MGKLPLNNILSTHPPIYSLRLGFYLYTNPLGVSLDSTMPPVVVVKSQLESRFFQLYLVIIPSIYLLRAFVEYMDTGGTPYTLLDHSRLLTELAMILALAFSKSLFSELPHTLKKLFSSPAFSQNNGESCSEAAFTKHLTMRLNHPYRHVVGFGTIMVMIVYYASTYNLATLSNRSLWGLLDQSLTAPPIVVYTYFLGIVLWKFLIISHALQKIPDKFTFKTQFGHPDNAGGLLPIGLICLKLIYIPVVPTILSALLLVFGYTSLIQLGKIQYILMFWLLTCSLIGSIIGLLPIFKFHQVMLMQRDDEVSMLTQISDRIVKLKQEFVRTSSSLERGTAESYKSDIAAYESFYQSHQHINTWPVNRKVLIELWATQTFLLSQLAAAWNLIAQFI